MTTKRERKHPRITVTGDIPIDERIPRWEAELLLAALQRLASPTTKEATDASAL